MSSFLGNFVDGYNDLMNNRGKFINFKIRNSFWPNVVLPSAGFRDKESCHA